MSGVDWVPELATALDRLVPLDDGSGADWDDVAGRVRTRSRFHVIRTRPRRSLRLAIVIAALFLLLAGVATATYLLVRNNGDVALGGSVGNLQVVNPSEPGLHALARCSAGSPECAFSSPTWSPDGAHIAFLSGSPGGALYRSSMSLYVANLDGRGRRLSPCGACGAIGGAGGPAWSPDSKWIAFMRDEGVRPHSSVWVVAATGGKRRRLTHCDSCTGLGPVWSPNGHVILFTRATRRPGTSGVYTIRPDGSGLTRILSGGSDLEWSPDGRRIVFDSGSHSIAVAHADGSRVHVLFSGAGPGTPSWSPDGRKIVFFNAPGGRRNFRAEVWTMNADGSGKERLYRSGCCYEGLRAPPIWSPDGRLIAFSADSAGGTFVINADGTGLRRLSPTLFSELSWQPLREGQQSEPPATRPLVLAPATWPYLIPPVRSCLIRHHAGLAPSKATLSKSELQWVLARNNYGPSVWITMSFLPDPEQAADHERSDERTLRTALNVGSAWLRDHITRRRNVVIEDTFRGHPLTAVQLATIAGCLGS